MRTPTFVITVVAAGSILSGCSTPQASEPEAAQPVKTEVVAPAAAPRGVRYSASIEPFEQVPLAFKAAGYVDSMMRLTGADGKSRVAQAGDRVTRGSVLARIREADYRERVNQGRARLTEGEASLVKARLDLERARTLFGQASLTKPELDAAQAAFETAEAKVAALRSDIELALIALRDCALVSPATGVILERRIEVGTLAASGTVGFVLGDLSSVKARFGIPDGMIHSIHLGDAIEVIVEAGGAPKFSGRVTAIAPAADSESRVFDVEVSIPNQDGRLRPGMIGTVSIGAAADRAAENKQVAVPLTAIVRSETGDGQFALFVVEHQDGAEVARTRRVELGEVVGNGIAVTSGLKAGERVVTSGAALLVDGERISVMP